ncbi:6-pyruvoyl trahydropterin synthase family protein [Calidithermus chliarophilus]|uniref:6-pyruvoyl trahydropterin synthase family protein n=1 Tax=Calidithermus chliarophilus TaxID=52023 RepID=UPI0004173CD4|nr:6-carboxytetrahydropterin synthase [Calidithermus chliarophilus]
MPRWKLSTEFTFDSAHYIQDYDGPCGRIHGHTYRVLVEATADRLYPSEHTPHPSMVADFKTLKWAKKDVTQGGLDHALLNDILPEGYHTTAELIAQYIHDETKRRVPDGVKLKVTVWETPTSWVEYEDD